MGMQSPPPPPPSGGYPPPPPPPPGGYQPPPPPPGGGYPQMPYGGGQAPVPYTPQGGYGGFWIRVVAYIIDGIILSVISVIVDAIFRANPTDPSSPGYAAANAVNFGIDIAYFIGFWSYWSATPGQRLFKLRVADANTMQPIGPGKAVLRYIGLIIAFIVCFIGVIWVAFDPRKQGWQDKIAGTVVLQG